MPSVKLTKFTGINNVAYPMDMTSSDLLLASNVDVTNSQRLRRRHGFVVLDGSECYSTVFEATGFTLTVTKAGQMCAWRDGVPTVLHPSLGGRVWMTELPDGRVAFSNGLQSGLTDGQRVTSWGVQQPDHVGTVIHIPGQLQPGSYRWAVCFVRDDGLEGGLITSEPVQLQRPCGLAFMGLPEAQGLKTRVYLTRTDGEQFYFAGDAVEGQLRLAQHDSAVLARTLDLRAPPAGILLSTCNGRALVALDDMLLASQPTLPEQFDMVRDFRRFEGRITLVQPVSGGIYVGTVHALYFLEGGSFDALALRTVLRQPVVLGSGVAVDGHHIRVGDGSAPGECMVCIAGGHIVAGLGGGQLVHMSKERYRTDCQEVSAAFRHVAGVPQYMAQVLR